LYVRLCLKKDADGFDSSVVLYDRNGRLVREFNTKARHIEITGKIHIQWSIEQGLMCMYVEVSKGLAELKHGASTLVIS